MYYTEKDFDRLARIIEENNNERDLTLALVAFLEEEFECDMNEARYLMRDLYEDMISCDVEEYEINAIEHVFKMKLFV